MKQVYSWPTSSRAPAAMTLAWGAKVRGHWRQPGSIFFRPLRVMGIFCALAGRAAFLFRRNPRYSPGSTLKKKKGQISDQCGAHHHLIGGLTHAKTQGLGPTVSQSGLFLLSAAQPW